MLQVSPATSAQADAYILGVTPDRKAPGLASLPAESQDAVQAILRNAAVALPFKAVRSLPTPAGWAVLVGLGDEARLTQEKLGTLANLGARAAAGCGATSAFTTLVTDTWDDAAAAQAVTEGALIGSLDFDQWKSKPAEYKPTGEKRKFGAEEPKPAHKLGKLFVKVPPGPKGTSARKAIARGAVLAAAVNDARLLANTPANIATPDWLANEARARGRKHGFKVEVLGRKELRAGGYGALCGVGQGSDNPECLITMEYVPDGWKAPAPQGGTGKRGRAGGKTLAVVGKGVCFDSGGISLKPGDKMWEMKYDKCGACNTIALMAALRDLGVKHRVIGIVPAVENLPSGTAQRPGDIVTAKDGTTIEVLNTDAEGRLILADAITHARTFAPDWIIDMATLTGACEVAVGPTHVAVMGNDDAFAKRVVESARAAGDKAWQLPQGEEFDEANKGAYADLQNISLTIRAGASIGGSFLSISPRTRCGPTSTSPPRPGRPAWTTSRRAPREPVSASSRAPFWTSSAGPNALKEPPMRAAWHPPAPTSRPPSTTSSTWAACASWRATSACAACTTCCVRMG